MSIPLIRSAFESRLKVWADSQTPVIPIAFQNVGFTKTSVPFLEPVLIPNLLINRDVAASHERYVGLWQVNCWSPIGKGMGQAESLAENVKQLFPVIPKVGNLSIEKPPRIEKSMTDTSSGGWIIVPLLIHYRYEA